MIESGRILSNCSYNLEINTPQRYDRKEATLLIAKQLSKGLIHLKGMIESFCIFLWFSLSFY